jgi:ribosomal protein S12 methylthiotransferase accessory factor
VNVNGSGRQPAASQVPNLLERSTPDLRTEVDWKSWLCRLLAKRAAFGVTRVGSITRLDRVGLPVVQVVRPDALSNAVSQGKGTTFEAALASGFMEAVETWAGERISPAGLTDAHASVFGSDIVSLYDPWFMADDLDGWKDIELSWIDGWDLLAGRSIPVPTAVVDTVYSVPSPHPHVFPRTTTGLGAGRTFLGAVLHAGLEILERDALAEARRTHGFFERWQTDPAPVMTGSRANLLTRIHAAGLLTGFWQAPARHGLPVYWCHVMEQGSDYEFVPLPSEGFGCAATHAHAMEKALLEACQARLTAISGAREDITRRSFPSSHDRNLLAEWRRQIAAPRRIRMIQDTPSRDDADVIRLDGVLEALVLAGARAVIAVPLLSDRDDEIHVVRLVAPPLRLNPRT